MTNGFDYYLGMPPMGAVAILLSTVLMYFAFTVVLRASGQRLFASPSSFELAVVAVLGAIVGRAILGMVPTLSGGLLALGTLLALEAVSGRVRRSALVQRRAQHRAVAIVVASKPDRELMRRHKVDDSLMWAALRGAGIRNLHDVALVILEQNGRFSVLRNDAPIHRAALTGVRRANEVFERLEAADLTVSSHG